MLAVGTDRGVVLWDLARGTELAFLPNGNAWHMMFEPSGDLLTNGSSGVLRWPVRLDPQRSVFRIGPPRVLPLTASNMAIDEDRRGRILAVANGGMAHVLTTQRSFQVGPLDDCRFTAVSPDGQWLATGSHHRGGTQIWNIRNAARVADVPSEMRTGVSFSPDGKWLMTGADCQLWAVGTWRERVRIGGAGLCFSPDSRLLVVQDESMVLRLVETATGQTVARFESPDQCRFGMGTFSPDGSRLVVTTHDGPSARVWDLRAIRRKLALMGLDWDAPAYSDDDPADPSAPPLPPLQIEYGTLKQDAAPAEDLVARYTVRLNAHPDDLESLHARGHELLKLKRFDEALADFSAASAQRPVDAHLRAFRGICLLSLKRYAPALDQLESALKTDPQPVRAIGNLDQFANDLAWMLATGPEPQRDPVLAVRLASFSLALTPGKQTSVNTLGVALYRAGKFADAITQLEKSLESVKGRTAAFDLFFLAMAHHRLGHVAQAHDCFDRAVHLEEGFKELPEHQARELATFRAEAKNVMGGAADELPDKVNAHPR
jgi:tetratricopeptide (TPR) repeat protein